MAAGGSRSIPETQSRSSSNASGAGNPCRSCGSHHNTGNYNAYGISVLPAIWQLIYKLPVCKERRPWGCTRTSLRNLHTQNVTCNVCVVFSTTRHRVVSVESAVDVLFEWFRFDDRDEASPLLGVGRIDVARSSTEKAKITKFMFQAPSSVGNHGFACSTTLFLVYRSTLMRAKSPRSVTTNPPAGSV